MVGTSGFFSQFFFIFFKKSSKIFFWCKFDYFSEFLGVFSPKCQNHKIVEKKTLVGGCWICNRLKPKNFKPKKNQLEVFVPQQTYNQIN